MGGIKRIFITFFLIFILCGSGTVCSKAANKMRTRSINIVYDDSGSMVRDKGGYNTRWSQAKYALEVFAAMMGSKDTLKIFPMSSYSYIEGEKSSTWNQTVSLKGNESVNSRIEKIHNMNGANGGYLNTPISSVKSAGEDLIQSKADEKWLLIITDGAFDNGKGKQYKPGSEKVKDTVFHYVKDSSIKVVFIAIDLENNLGIDDQDFYYYKATDNDILRTVTNVAQQVYNYMSIDKKKEGTSYSFVPDIPVSKVIVFSQGKKVTVNDLVIDSEVQKAVSVGKVNVDKDTSIYPRFSPSSKYEHKELKIAEKLNGQVAVYSAMDEDIPFKDNVQYLFECLNDDETEVYFEPGVDIQAVLIDSKGNETSLSDQETDSVEAGRKTLHVKVVNPLTGKEIDPSDSKLINNVQLLMSLKDKNGKIHIYKDGEIVDVPEGKINIYASAVFEDGSEKSSDSRTIKVTPAQMSVSFTKPQYSFDPVSLITSDPIVFSVMDSDGEAFSKEEYESLTFDNIEGRGIKWEIKAVEGQLGKYEMIPSFEEDKSVGDIETSVYELQVIAHIKQGKITRNGAATTKLGAVLDGTIKLSLDLTLPEEKIFTSGNEKKFFPSIPGITVGPSNKPYMFDCGIRSVTDFAPYILVKVAVIGSDGKQRIMTKEEWDQGVYGFSFKGKPVNPGIIKRIICVLCRQKLEFVAVKDREVSTYRLYLNGSRRTSVLPNTSDLKVDLKIKLKNGVIEKGSEKARISVRPAGLLPYIGIFLLMLLLFILLLILLVCEMRKPRFDREMYPNTQSQLKKAGLPFDPGLGIQYGGKSIKHRFWPPMKPEERDVVMKYGAYQTSITFHLRATGNGGFVITNIKKFERVKDRVSFDGASYEKMEKAPRGMTVSSIIQIRLNQGLIDGTLIMTFLKPKRNEDKKKKMMKTLTQKRNISSIKRRKF